MKFISNLNHLILPINVGATQVVALLKTRRGDMIIAVQSIPKKNPKG